MAKYYTLVTDVGRAKMANAQVMGQKVSFSQIALGSSETKPRENQTALGKEEWRGPISNVSLDRDNPNWIVVEAVVPSNVGGFEIAEVGVYDEEGHLIVVGNHPKTYKPKMDEGTTKDVAIRIIIEVSNSEIVELKVDPSVVIATREYVESAIELAMASIDFSTVEKQINQHVSDADTHVTAQDKKNWNAKETPSAAQAKAAKALKDAKAYTDQQIGEMPEVDTSHLETKEEANKKLEKAKSYTDLHSERTDNPHKVTKSQVGLSNVDNVKQASKVDLDSHINDEVKHVTASERASWNAKETPTGAQAKATKALEDAKVYTDTHEKRTDNPHKVTKSQIGLSNVDNVKQASKVDLDNHIGDGVRHITASERSSWNAKETPTGAQQKATKVLEDAKSYTDTHSNRTDNPHKVTKSQIGLGKVANYEVATKAEAEEGTSNNTYMTALRVVESIAKNESVSSVQGKKGDVQFSTDLHDDITWIEANAFDADAFPEEYPTGVSVFRTTLTGQDGWNELTGSKIKNVRYLILTFNDGAVKSNYYQFIVRMRTPGNYSTTYEGTWVRTAFNGNGSWNGPIKILNQGDLSDSTTSNSSDTIATSKAIKDTMDAAKAAQQRADEAFTLGDKVKKDLVASLSSSGLPIKTTDSFETIIKTIENSNTKDIKTAVITLESGQTNVTGLNFKPDFILPLSGFLSTSNSLGYGVNHKENKSDGTIQYGGATDASYVEYHSTGFRLTESLSSDKIRHNKFLVVGGFAIEDYRLDG